MILWQQQGNKRKMKGNTGKPLENEKKIKNRPKNGMNKLKFPRDILKKMQLNIDVILVSRIFIISFIIKCTPFQVFFYENR